MSTRRPRQAERKDILPVGAFSQDFEHSEILSGDGGNGGRGGDIGSHNRIKNSNDVNNTTINFYGPQFIVNSDGKSLDLDMTDKKSVISHPFHGGLNQQWLVQDDENGGVVLKSKYNGTYVAAKNPDLSLDGALVSTNDPFSWKISKDGSGYKLAAPNSDLGLSLGNAAILSEGQGTRLYILENTPENQAAIENGKLDPSSPTTMSSTSKRSDVGANINVIINDLSGSENALKDLQNFITSDSVKNLVIYVGNHQAMDFSTPSSTIGPSPSPPYSSNLGASLTRQECTGFPTGYFRIRAAGTQHYWSVHYGETSHDGNAICLWHLGNDNVTQVRQWFHFYHLCHHSLTGITKLFFVNSKGELCTSGAHIDVMSEQHNSVLLLNMARVNEHIGHTLILAHDRPQTFPSPNPWSHPAPTFSYSKETKIMTAKFYADPLISDQWPRPEKEWKDKEFVIAARAPTQVKIHLFNEISRWAPNSRLIRWTCRAGDLWPANEWNNLGVVEKADIMKLNDTERMKWEIEQV
ncbi:hypothetical protein BDZ97DRAFT_51308 [Flammula alnicola]|nr:hypothetical protein BDZ97DRAFT_51308 [Flammula alnicola]